MEEEGCRRLAVRAGHADDLELAGRLAEKGVRCDRHRDARRRNDELRHVGVESALDDQRDGARLDRVRGELVAVEVLAGDAEEGRAGSHRAGVVGELPHLHGSPAEDRLRCERGDQALELHVRRNATRRAAEARHGRAGTQLNSLAGERTPSAWRRVRRDLELGEAVPGDLGEGRCGDDAAPDREARLVDRDEHDQPRILGGTTPTNEAT